MRKNVLSKAFTAILFLLFATQSWSQPWTYDFGTATGTYTSSTAVTSPSTLPAPPSGTARARIGTNPGSIALVNPGLAGLGTGSELQITSNTGSTSTTRFSVYDYTAGKVGYAKFKIAFAGGTNGVYKFSMGDGTNYSDNNAFATSQIFAGVEWTFGASNTVSYKVLNGSTYGTTGITNPTGLFVQSTTTIYQVEVYINNTTSAASYFRGSSNNLAAGTWDLWVDGTRVGAGLARGGQSANTSIDSYAFYHQNSATAPGTLYIDDIEYSNALPAATTSATDHFRSQASGNWSDVATWESSADNTNWIDATLAPTSSAADVNILASHTVTATSAITVSDVTIDAGGILSIAPTSAITVPAGKEVGGLGAFVLQSSAAGTARVATSAGNISATTYAQRYIPGGRRAFRFFSHPFSSAIGLNQITDSIDITGAGGAANGFTATVTNSPSAFYYDPTLPNAGTNDPNGTDYGWVAFTNTDGLGANAWNAKQGIRVLARGAKGEGLNGIAYTPSESRYTIAGILNSGNQSLTVSAAGFNLLGNPYASPVNVGPAINAAGNLGTAYYVWDANAATKGAYVTQVINGTTYNLDVNAVIIVQATGATAINLTENDKAAAPTASLFRTPGTARSGLLELQLLQAGNYWDKLYVRFKDKALDEKDQFDAIKMGNADLNFYTLSADNQHLSLDSRKITDGGIIPLGIATGYKKDFTIKVADLGIEKDVELYLRDKFLHTDIKLEEGTEYTFSVTADAASFGDNRFELVQQKKVIAQPIVLVPAVFSVKLSPNPAKDHVIVNFNNEEKANTTIIFANSLGQTVKTVNAGNVQNGLISVDVKGLAKGNYFITLSNGKEKATQQLQIQ